METSLPVWHLDHRLATKGTSVLNGVRAVAPTETWAVGTAVDPDTGGKRALVGRWATDFQFVPAADPTAAVELSDVDFVGTEVWAVGNIIDEAGMRTRVERYHRNGKPPEVVASPSVDHDCALHGVTMRTATDGWAVGGSGVDKGKGGFDRTVITHWDGTTWSIVPSPSPGTLHNQLSAVAARTADDVWAVGHCSNADGHPVPLALHWDGVAWQQVAVPPSGIGDDELLDVATVGGTDVWIVGTSISKPSGRQLAFALRWDGTAWQTFRSAANQFTGVSARSATEVWVAGYAEAPDGLHQVGQLERWDGTRLSPVGPRSRGTTTWRPRSAR
ncbi:hypothetical protein GCM10029964_081570 [Kibdelosporangium lantanae]